MRDPFESHPKIQLLNDIVLEHFRTCANKSATRVMVFSSVRNAVVNLHHPLSLIVHSLQPLIYHPSTARPSLTLSTCSSAIDQRFARLFLSASLRARGYLACARKKSVPEMKASSLFNCLTMCLCLASNWQWWRSFARESIMSW